MRDVIDVLVIVALALQMLTNTVILLGVIALLYCVFRKQQSPNLAPKTEHQALVPVVENPCDHCQSPLGDPASSRIMGDKTVLIYQCPKCGLPTEKEA